MNESRKRWNLFYFGVHQTSSGSRANQSLMDANDDFLNWNYLVFAFLGDQADCNLKICGRNLAEILREDACDNAIGPSMMRILLL